MAPIAPLSAATESTPRTPSEAFAYALRLENAAVALTILYGRDQPPEADILDLLHSYVQGNEISYGQGVRLRHRLRFIAHGRPVADARVILSGPEPLPVASAREQSSPLSA